MKLNAWLILGIIGITLFGSQFGSYYYRAVFSDTEIWWTPKTMALPFMGTKNEFEFFVNDELLQDHLKRESLSVTDLNGNYITVLPDDIVVRINNWQKTKTSFLHTAVYMALFLGVSLMSLIIGVMQILTGKTANKSTHRTL